MLAIFVKKLPPTSNKSARWAVWHANRREYFSAARYALPSDALKLFLRLPEALPAGDPNNWISGDTADGLVFVYNPPKEDKS